MPTEQEFCYRKQITRIGIAMLIFLGCTRVVQYAYMLLSYLTSDMRAVPRTVLWALIEAVLYSAMFLIPAFVLKKLLKNILIPSPSQLTEKCESGDGTEYSGKFHFPP